MMHGRYMTEWWETAYQIMDSSRCSREQVMSALNRTFALTPETYDLIENTSTISYSGMVSSYLCTVTLADKFHIVHIFENYLFRCVPQVLDSIRTQFLKYIIKTPVNKLRPSTTVPVT